MAAIFTGGISIYIFLNENFWILNRISLKYVLYGLVDNNSSLIQIMGCHRTGDFMENSQDIDK